MIETEYKQLVEFGRLPIFGEDDLRRESIERPYDPNFTGEVSEVETVEDARDLLSDPSWEPKGAIKYSDGESVNIRLYFWRKR